jgi:hypothetical protein
VPPEAAVPQHAGPLDSSARRCFAWMATDIPLRQAAEQGQPQGGCPLSRAIYRHQPTTAKVKTLRRRRWITVNQPLPGVAAGKDGVQTSES